MRELLFYGSPPPNDERGFWIVWPVHVFRVVARVPQNEPDIFGRAVLGACRSEKLDIRDIASILRLHPRFVSLVAERLVGNGYALFENDKLLAKPASTAAGVTNSAPKGDLKRILIFRDPGTGQYWDRYSDRRLSELCQGELRCSSGSRCELWFGRDIRLVDYRHHVPEETSSDTEITFADAHSVVKQHHRMDGDTLDAEIARKLEHAYRPDGPHVYDVALYVVPVASGAGSVEWTVRDPLNSGPTSPFLQDLVMQAATPRTELARALDKRKPLPTAGLRQSSPHADSDDLDLGYPVPDEYVQLRIALEDEFRRKLWLSMASEIARRVMLDFHARDEAIGLGPFSIPALASRRHWWRRFLGKHNRSDLDDGSELDLISTWLAPVDLNLVRDARSVRAQFALALSAGYGPVVEILARNLLGVAIRLLASSEETISGASDQFRKPVVLDCIDAMLQGFSRDQVAQNNVNGEARPFGSDPLYRRTT